MLSESLKTPSNQWLQLNIFCNQFSCDNLLVNQVLSLLKGLDKSIDIYFFIRYDYPTNHIRLRLKTRNNFNFNKFNNSILELEKINIIWKIEFDKYQKEVEQYSHMKIEHSEYLFYLNSKLILNFLTTQPEIGDKLDLALSYSVGFINAFWGNDETYIKKFIQGFSNEYSYIIVNRKEKKKLLGKRYRRIKIGNLSNENLSELVNLLKKNKRGNNLEEKYDFAYGHIHMFINRLFKSNQRIYEALIYALLGKYYKIKRNYN